MQSACIIISQASPFYVFESEGLACESSTSMASTAVASIEKVAGWAKVSTVEDGPLDGAWAGESRPLPRSLQAC